MKIKALKVLSLIFALCIVLSSSIVTTGAISYSNDVKTQSESILLVNMDSGQTVFEKDADSKRYPASTTKIMTYIIVVENIEDLDNTRVPIKEEVLAQLEGTGSSLANLEDHIGETMSVIDLLYSMMVPSGNDASVVLADYVGGGNIDSFVDMMNKKAEELGCENTHFENPEGLHDENHYTTARDMYKIATYALTLPKFSEITNTTTYYCEGDEVPLITTNLLIDQNRGGEYYYMYAKGIKTGTTDQAGRCLVTTATADGYSYMAVLLHSPYTEGVTEDYGTMTDAADLFRWALTSLELKTVATSETPVCRTKVNLAWGKDSVLLVPEKNLSAIVPKDLTDENIVTETEVPESVDAPLDTDTAVGTATIYYKDSKTGEKQEIAKVNLVPSEKIEMSGFLYVLNVITTVLQSYWFLVIIGIIIFILICYFIMSKINRKRSEKNRKVRRYRNL
ncbi:MAG: D-alanyl-D-alanine carboxypeptidase family protein [Ruminococcus sp.]|nr:D-alanyl-D-alanine carboxypeptidase family protein [Ruminococcus sp.]